MNLLEIDLSKLETEVSKIIGTEVKFVKSLESIPYQGDKKFLFLESQELVQATGVFSSVMKTVKLRTFSSSVIESDEDFLVNKIRDEVLYMLIGFSYKMKSRGSNGNNLLSCWYNIDKDKWMILVEGDGENIRIL